MSLFSAIVKVAVETVKLPVAVAKDGSELMTGGLHVGSETKEQLDKIKEASDG